MTQKEILRNHLETVGSISPVEALVVHRIGRLAARVCDLRDEGMNVLTNMSTDTTGHRYARYTYEKEA